MKLYAELGKRVKVYGSSETHHGNFRTCTASEAQKTDIRVSAVSIQRFMCSMETATRVMDKKIFREQSWNMSTHVLTNL